MTPDGRVIVAGANTTYAIDAETLRVVRRYPVGAFTLGISPDGDTLALERPGTDSVRLLDLASGRVQNLKGHHDVPRSERGFQPRRAQACDRRLTDGEVIVWDVREGRAIERLEGHRGPVWSQAFSPDGRTLYTAGDDSSVIIWDVAGDRRLGRPFRTNPLDETRESSPPVRPQPRRPHARGREAGRPGRPDRRRDAAPDRRLRGLRRPVGARDRVLARRAPAGGGRSRWRRRSLGRRVGEARRPAPACPGRPRAAQPPTTSKRWPSAWGACSPRPTSGEPCGSGTSTTGSWSADRCTWGVGRGWGWPSAPTARSSRSRPVPGAGTRFRPASTFATLAAASGSPGCPPSRQVRSVAFSPDGRLLVGGQIDGSTLVWATEGWRRVGQPLTLGGGQTLGLAFSPDGRTLATSHGDGTVELWDVGSQQPIGSPLPGLPDTWVTADFTPDGDRLFAVSDAGEAIRWEVDPEVWAQHACDIAGDLTPEQWEEVVPEQDYVSVCPSG